MELFLLFVAFAVVLIGFIVINDMHQSDKKDFESNTKGIDRVKEGDKIKVNITGFVVDATCLKNDPINKKMFIQFSNMNCKGTVVEYLDYTFINFNTLNPQI